MPLSSAFAARTYRVVSPRWAHAPLSGDGARASGGRFNPPGIAAFYSALDPHTAYAEYTQGLFDRPGLLCTFDIARAHVVDLREPQELVRLPTTLAAQLAALELGHLTVSPAEAARGLEPPAAEAVTQTLTAVWSDLFALLGDTVLEPQAEELGWGFVNLFHRAATKASGQIDRATDEIRLLLANADGSEIHNGDLEAQIERAQDAENAMLALEALREAAAALYLAETGSSWRPAGGSRLNHDTKTTSAVVQGRDFLRARVESRRRATMPVGTPVVFAGGRHSFASNEDASTFGTNVFATLEKVREHVPDMVLVHGGDSKGVDRLAASWAEQRTIPQIAFGLETRLGARAGFRRNEQMLSLNPRYVVAFAGNGVLERLVIDAKAKRISVVDRRGPLGTNPKLHARELKAAA